jgi:hypothetical protein
MAATSFSIGPDGWGFGTEDDPKIPRGSLRYQRNVLSNQIQWQTKDARAAGLHPLFALGKSGGVTPPAVVGGARSEASYQGTGKGQRSLEAAQLKLLEAQAAYYNSMANSAGAGSTTDVTGYQEGLDHTFDQIRKEQAAVRAFPIRKEPAMEVMTKIDDDSLQMGRHGAWKTYDVGPKGFPLRIESFVEPEELASLDQILSWPLVYYRNEKVIDAWAWKVFKEKSKIGKLGKFARFLFNMATSKVKGE